MFQVSLFRLTVYHLKCVVRALPDPNARQSTIALSPKRIVSTSPAPDGTMSFQPPDSTSLLHANREQVS